MGRASSSDEATLSGTVYKYQSTPHAQPTDRRDSEGLTSVTKRAEEIHLSRKSPSITGAEDQIEDIVVLVGGLTPMRRKTDRL